MRHFFGRILCIGWLLLAATAQAATVTKPERSAIHQQLLKLRADDGHGLPAVMTYPASGLQSTGPVIIHCQGGPGATPLEGSGPWLAEGLAERGYTVIAPMNRHGDQLFSFNFTELDRDVKAAIDFAESLGFTDIILAGSSFGSITITRYMVDTQDARVRALLHFAPTADMGSFVRRGMGDGDYFAAVSAAGELVSRGEGMSRLFAPYFNAPAPFPAGIRIAFTHYAQVWLDLWGPASHGVNSLLFGQIRQPMLLLLGDQDGFNDAAMLAKLKQAASRSERVDTLFYEGGVNHSFYPRHADVIADTVSWLGARGLAPTAEFSTRVVTIHEGRMGEGMRRGVQYAPARESANVVLMVHDWSDDALHGGSVSIGPLLAATGVRAVAINAVRGDAELLRSTWRQSDAAIKDWIDAQPAASKIVLLGQGVGALRVAHYLANSSDARVTRAAWVDARSIDAEWLQQALGGPAVADLLRQAADGQIVSADIPAASSWSGGPRRLVMDAAAFNDLFGSKDNALAVLRARIKVPLWQGTMQQALQRDVSGLSRFIAQP